MKIRSLPRGGGKTTWLIEQMKRNVPSTGVGLCVSGSEQEARRLYRLAKEEGVDTTLWKFVSLEESRKGAGLMGWNAQVVAVDNLDTLLQQVIGHRVNFATQTEPSARPLWEPILPEVGFVREIKDTDAFLPVDGPLPRAKRYMITVHFDLHDAIDQFEVDNVKTLEQMQQDTGDALATTKVLSVTDAHGEVHVLRTKLIRNIHIVEVPRGE